MPSCSDYNYDMFKYSSFQNAKSLTFIRFLKYISSLTYVDMVAISSIIVVD